VTEKRKLEDYRCVNLSCRFWLQLDAVISHEPFVDGEVQPEPNDFALCTGCGKIYRYDDKMLLHPVSWNEIPEDSREEFAVVERARKNFMKDKKVLDGKIVMA
jgi:hypothetical protein